MVVSTVTADDLAPPRARASAATLLTTSESIVYTGLAL